MSHAYVVNIRDGSADLLGDTVIRIDRANPLLGNPYPLTRRLDMQERMRVLNLHQEHVQADIKKGGPISQAIEAMAEEVASGETLALQCWCSPLPCHGDFLVKLVNERAQQIRRPRPETPR